MRGDDKRTPLATDCTDNITAIRGNTNVNMRTLQKRSSIIHISNIMANRRLSSKLGRTHEPCSTFIMRIYRAIVQDYLYKDKNKALIAQHQRDRTKMASALYVIYTVVQD